MKSQTQTNYRSYNLIIIAVITLLIFSISIGVPISSFPQMTSVTSTPLNQTVPNKNNFVQYENPKYGFNIQYPSDWRVEEAKASGTAMVAAFFSPLEANSDAFSENFNIGVAYPTTPISLDKYGQAAVALLKSQPPGSDFKLAEGPVSTTFGGLPAQKIEYATALPGNESARSLTNIRGMQVWTIKDDSIYTFSFGAELDKFSSYLPTIEKIIGTFRITNSTQ